MKRLAFATAVLLAVALSVPTAFAVVDVNGDGVMNVKDAVLTTREAHVPGTLTEAQMKAADVNRDGKVDDVDAQSILDAVAGTYAPDVITGGITSDVAWTYVGGSVTLTASVVGGFGVREYQYSLQSEAGGAPILLRDYTQDSIVTVSPAAAGTFTLCLNVRDALGQTVAVEGGTLTVSAVETYGEDLRYALSPDGAVVVKWMNATANTVEVPATLGGENAVTIGDGAFEGMASLTAVTLPDSVEVIGKAAFKNCTALVSMNAQ